MKASIIISTYNSPLWLAKVLTGFSQQSFQDFEIIVADDGSMEETRFLIEKFQKETNISIQHVWHEDQGFRKCDILNKAIKTSKNDYLIFTDGDCIPRRDFVATHLIKRKKGCFLSGGYFKLPLSISEKITEQEIINQQCFDINWLKNNGLKKSFKNNKLTSSPLKARFLNWITPTKATWNGHNSSGWKSDIEAVNGFDERMKYGAEDREMGERMLNNGIKGVQIRYSAICVHLDHERSYVNEKDLKNNAKIREETKKNKAVWTNFGIVK